MQKVIIYIKLFSRRYSNKYIYTNLNNSSRKDAEAQRFELKQFNACNTFYIMKLNILNTYC